MSRWLTPLIRTCHLNGPLTWPMLRVLQTQEQPSLRWVSPQLPTQMVPIWDSRWEPMPRARKPVRFITSSPLDKGYTMGAAVVTLRVGMPGGPVKGKYVCASTVSTSYIDLGFVPSHFMTFDATNKNARCSWYANMGNGTGIDG